MFAGAKINLSLKVTGRRPDGYHTLDSLVVHTADLGDELSLATGEGLSLKLAGPFGEELKAENNNLVLKAARALGVENAAFTLIKNLPLASGIGGGSADAAAALKLLNQTFALAHSNEALEKIAIQLGADVPMCLTPVPKRVTGLGEIAHPIALPKLHLVLVNPGIAMPTGPVFQHLQTFSAPPSQPPIEMHDLAQWIAKTSNDLLPHALSRAPQIGAVLEELAAQKTICASGMSGSGATCFGLFKTRKDADAAAKQIQSMQPGWWCRAATSVGAKE